MPAHNHSASRYSPTKGYYPISEAAQKLKDDELDRDGLRERLNEAAVAAHLSGDFKGEAVILMQLAKFLGYLNKADMWASSQL